MNWSYIVSGISIVNDIIYADNRRTAGLLGGCCVFAYSGIRLLTEAVLPVTSCGSDFTDYFGDYWKHNRIPSDGVYHSMPFTHHTVLKYNTDGSWKDESIYGKDYFEKQAKNCDVTYEKLFPFLSPSLKGLYLDSNAFERIFNDIERIREKAPNARIMWEPTTVSYTDPTLRETVLNNINKVDFYSCNLSEAMMFFEVESREKVVSSIINLQKPCFLREGEKGSSWIENGIDTGTIPSEKADQAVDPTGCGNCSTAVSLYLRREGFKPREICAVANHIAFLTAKQHGPIPELNCYYEDL